MNLKSEGVFDRGIQKLLKHPLLTKEEELQLVRVVNNGNEKKRAEAREKLCLHNLRYVAWVVSRHKHLGDPNALFSRGVAGLLLAIDRADAEKMKMGNTRFMSYAVNWIRQALQMFGAEETHVIRRPRKRIDQAVKIAREIPDNGSDGNGVNRTNEEQTLLSLLQPPLSLNTPLLVKGVTKELEEYIDVLADEQIEHPEQEAESWWLRKAVKELLEKTRLTENERKVLVLRFGLNGGEPMKLSEIGAQLKLSRERIRQIERKAIQKLRQRAPKLFPDGF